MARGRKEGLTQKEDCFVSKYFETGSATEAVMQCYNTDSRRNARGMAVEIKRRPLVQEAIHATIHAEGLVCFTCIKAQTYSSKTISRLY